MLGTAGAITVPYPLIHVRRHTYTHALRCCTCSRDGRACGPIGVRRCGSDAPSTMPWYSSSSRSLNAAHSCSRAGRCRRDADAAGMHRDRAGLATVLLLLLLLLELLIRPPGSRQADESPAVHLGSVARAGFVCCMLAVVVVASRAVGGARLGRSRRRRPTASAGVLGASRVPQQRRV